MTSRDRRALLLQWVVAALFVLFLVAYYWWGTRHQPSPHHPGLIVIREWGNHVRHS